MKYEDMSNLQLNCKLAVLDNYDEGWVSRHPELVRRYCTEWNATMPLAIEHGVSLSKPEKNIDNWFADVVDSSYALSTDCDYRYVSNPEFQSSHKNPLRAIVVCLIKVLESENEKP